MISGVTIDSTQASATERRDAVATFVRAVLAAQPNDWIVETEDDRTLQELYGFDSAREARSVLGDPVRYVRVEVGGYAGVAGNQRRRYLIRIRLNLEERETPSYSSIAEFRSVMEAVSADVPGLVPALTDLSRLPIAGARTCAAGDPDNYTDFRGQITSGLDVHYATFTVTLT